MAVNRHQWTWRWSFFLLFLTAMTSSLRAHVVAEIPAKASSDGSFIILEVAADYAFSLDEMPDYFAPQPKREILFDLTPTEHQYTRDKLRYYFRNTLQFHDSKGGVIEPEFVYPDYQSTPPTFPKMVSGGAYVTVIMRIPLPEEGFVKVSHVDPRNPYFWITVSAATSEDSEFVYLYPGQNTELKFLKQNNLTAGAVPPTSSSPSRWRSFIEFIKIGYQHVIPEGWDHILFIAALCLLCMQWKPLLHQTLIFTLAHSVTLGLCVSGVFVALPSIIEPIIALSIVWMAVENLFHKEIKRTRMIMVFLFGLIHGMGFGNMLARKIEASGDFGLSLFASNLGVELAQITVVALLIVVTWKFRETPAYSKFRIFASILIAIAGTQMFIERII